MRRSRWVVLVLLLAVLGPAPSRAAPSRPARLTGAQVAAVSFDQTLKHNLANLIVSLGSASAAANFLDYFNATGGVARWGYPTSEVFQSEPGNLGQFFQRGVVDWHWRDDIGAYVVERRLAWDYLGGDRAGPGADQGVESAGAEPGNGAAVGPWGHMVSDVAADGTRTGFRAFFDRYGGVRSFGYPKSEARPDPDGPGGLHVPGATPGFIRQYFQAAVFEYHSDSSAPVQLRLLGDDLRDHEFPNDSWRSLPAFQPANPVYVGQFVGVDSLAGTPVAAPALQLDAPAAVRQGATLQVRVFAPATTPLKAAIDDRPLALYPQAPAGPVSLWLAYVGFDPLAPAVSHTVSVSNGDTTVSRRVAVTAVKWPVETFITNAQQNAVASGDNVPRENAMLRPIFTAITPRQLWSGTFSYPLDAPLTDGFGVFRSYNGGPANTYHEGRDLGANLGTPILAAAAGQVVLARPLTVRGNAVILDHGLGVFTGYYHQSRIAVHEGQSVQKGDLLGYVGDTGFANGAHLHWELRIGNVYVDPDEWARVAFGA